ncbi:MAG: class I SAM-dependent methyltransferase [Candidatus Thorarchaeota archaeon]|nr:class I SAM-dependent methyltransferase [Candidatus Thorarchaeota archaeon]
MQSIEVFEKNAQEYDEWFKANRFVYESEIKTVRRVLPASGRGLEIGVGTGRFAEPLGIRVGVEPAREMAEIAQSRGIEVLGATAERLPFRDASFDFVVMVVTICFVQDPLRAIREAARVLVPGGTIIVGLVDRDSFLGRQYESRKNQSKFYQPATFYSASEVSSWLSETGFTHVESFQTLFKDLSKITAVEPFRSGHGQGGFVVFSAQIP